MCAACVLALAPCMLPAQDLVPVDDETQVSSIGFRGNRVMYDRELKPVIVTLAPGPLRFLAFWSSKKFPFSPIELQKDVNRLRRFYARSGFLHTNIDYVVDLDTASNKLDINFVITEGEPLILQSVDFVGENGRAAVYSIAEAERDSWRHFRRQSGTLRLGSRPSEGDIVRIKDEALTWLTNHGYAFGDVLVETDTDSAANVVDLRFRVLPGPQTTIDSIMVQRLDGQTAISDRTIRRQVPFDVGDSYSRRQIVRGQRNLFAMSAFRVVMIDLNASQPDSNVTVRIRLQQAKLNVMRASTGYSFDDGATLEAEYQRRNFFGSARLLTVSNQINTRLGERSVEGFDKSYRRRHAASINQPYFLRKGLSASITAFFSRIEDSVTQEEEYGGATSFTYEIIPFRTVSSTISLSRANPIGPSSIGESTFTRGIVSVAAIFGKADNYLEPSRGLLIRPTLEHGTAILLSDIKYWKTGISISAYRHVGVASGVAGRLFGGKLFPGGGVTDDEAIQSKRFNSIRYYAGGSNDVRGWGPAALGPKNVVVDTTVVADAEPIINYRYEPVGALYKIAGNLSYRFPIPGFGLTVQSAIFTDFAKLGSDKLRIGSGVGIRYKTPVGFLRLDFGVKMNPSDQDLRNAGSDQEHPWKRLRFHFGIGNAF